MQGNKPTIRCKMPPGRNQDKPRPTATTLLSGAQPPTFGPQPPTSGLACCYCQLPHSSTDCTSVPSVNRQKQILRTSGRCFNCLRKGHLGRNCRSPRKCLKCDGRHHSSICEGRSPKQTPLTSEPSSACECVDPATQSWSSALYCHTYVEQSLHQWKEGCFATNCS